MAQPIVFADSVQPELGIALTPEVLERLEVADPAVLADVKRKQEADPVTCGWAMPAWERVLADWQRNFIFCVLGGNRCISGDTPIYDPVADTLIPLRYRAGAPFHVLAWDGAKLVPAYATSPVEKAPMPVYRVRVDGVAGGRRHDTFTCAGTHQLLTPAGYMPLSSLAVGQRLVCPRAADGSGFATIHSIEPVGQEPVWDISVPEHGNYWAAGTIHHNSGKSEFMARLSLWVAMNVPGARVRCWSMNEESSVNDQQRAIWNSLPSGYKSLPNKRVADYSISYTQKNGFTGGKLILPPVKPGYAGSEIIFQTYKSWANDPQVAEGWWAHFIWADEEIPLKLFETLIYRTYDARGRIGLSFTTLNGWTPTVADLLNGAKTVEKRYAPLVGRELPVVQQAKRARTGIYYFWTQDNHFIPYEDFLADLASRPEAEKLARAYGVPTKGRANVFSLFNSEVHVVSHDDIPFIKNPKYAVTKYHGIDPAGRKPWVVVWGAYDGADTLWIYREFPDVDTYGEWVDPGGGDGGKAGPAQLSNQFGLKDYKRVLFDGREQEDCDIYMSAIDPRFAASEAQGEDGAETILSRMRDLGVDLVPSPGKQITDGEAIITDRLKYDHTRPVGADNRPRLMISDRCKNTIYALENYTGSGQDEPCKDYIDAIRYLVQTAVGFVDPNEPVSTEGSGY